jgi:hypothetical protein
LPLPVEDRVDGPGSSQGREIDELDTPARIELEDPARPAFIVGNPRRRGALVDVRGDASRHFHRSPPDPSVLVAGGDGVRRKRALSTGELETRDG